MTLLWYPDRGPEHNNHRYPGQSILRWCGSDTESLFLKNTGDANKRQQLEKLGWLEEDIIAYQLNNQCFRCDEFDDRPAGIAIGCSHTMGIGIREDQTWPYILSSMMGIHIWNLGVAGAGLDSNFRLIDHYLDILKPKFVVHAVPSMTRFEYYGFGEFNSIIVNNLPNNFPFNDFFREYFFNDINSELNARRNLLAIKYICDRAKIPYYSIDVSETLDMDGEARDLMHPGSKSQKKFAEEIFRFINLNPHGGQDGHTRISSGQTARTQSRGK